MPGPCVPVLGWRDKPAERGIEIKPMLVSDVLERTEWPELLGDMVAAGEIKLLPVAGEYAPERTADAQRALAGGLRGRPVIRF